MLPWPPQAFFDREGYHKFGLIGSALIFIAILTSAIGIHHRIPELRRHEMHETAELPAYEGRHTGGMLLAPLLRACASGRLAVRGVVRTLLNRSLGAVLGASLLFGMSGGLSTNLWLYMCAAITSWVPVCPAVWASWHMPARGPRAPGHVPSGSPQHRLSLAHAPVTLGMQVSLLLGIRAVSNCENGQRPRHLRCRCGNARPFCRPAPWQEDGGAVLWSAERLRRADSRAAAPLHQCVAAQSYGAPLHHHHLLQRRGNGSHDLDAGACASGRAGVAVIVCARVRGCADALEHWTCVCRRRS